MFKAETEILKQIDAYVKGTLTDKEIDDLWVLFAQDPLLIERLKLEIAIDKIVNEMKITDKNPSFITKRPVFWHSLAACMIILIGVIQFLKIPPKTVLSEFAFLTIENHEYESSSINRGHEHFDPVSDSLLNAGLQAMKSGNINLALLYINQVAKDGSPEPYASKALLNKGIIYYNKAEYDSSISAFLAVLDRVGEGKIIKEKAYWYLSNAYVNIEDLVNAREAAQIAYSLNGVYRKAAFLLIQKINYDLGYSEKEDFR